MLQFTAMPVPVHMRLHALCLTNSNSPFWFQRCCYFPCTIPEAGGMSCSCSHHSLCCPSGSTDSECVPNSLSRMPLDDKRTLRYLWQTLLASQEPSSLFLDNRSPVSSPVLTGEHSATPQGMSQSWWESIMVHQLILARRSLFQPPFS